MLAAAKRAAGLVYSVASLPWLVVPIVAWAAIPAPASRIPPSAGNPMARSGGGAEVEDGRLQHSGIVRRGVADR